jgi:hypothetical protein
MVSNRGIPPMSRGTTKSELSAAQLAARRANARLSTGPRTPEGKAIAALNSVQHGLCSHAAVLPGESVEEFQATLDGWIHELKPVDAHERELVYNMVCASIAIQRVRKADNAAVSARVRDAGDTWVDARAAGLKALVGALGENKTEAHAALLRRGDGCRWLIARWRELDEMLARGGYWDFKERDFAIRLLGVHSGALRNEAVRLVHGLGMALEAEMGLDKVKEHALNQKSFGLEVLHEPNPREALRGIVADELEALESLLPVLEKDDAADRESAIAASYVDTSDDGLRRHRYLQDHLRTLRQLSASLLASKKARQAPQRPGTAAFSVGDRGSEARTPATPRPTPAAAEAPIRNEPKNDANSLPESSSDAKPVPVATRVVSKLFAGWSPRPATALPGVV